MDEKKRKDRGHRVYRKHFFFFFFIKRILSPSVFNFDRRVHNRGIAERLCPEYHGRDETGENQYRSGKAVRAYSVSSRTRYYSVRYFIVLRVSHLAT